MSLECSQNQVSPPAVPTWILSRIETPWERYGPHVFSPLAARLSASEGIRSSSSHQRNQTS